MPGAFTLRGAVLCPGAMGMNQMQSPTFLELVFGDGY